MHLHASRKWKLFVRQSAQEKKAGVKTKKRKSLTPGWFFLRGRRAQRDCVIFTVYSMQTRLPLYFLALIKLPPFRQAHKASIHPPHQPGWRGALSPYGNDASGVRRMDERTIVTWKEKPPFFFVLNPKNRRERIWHKGSRVMFAHSGREKIFSSDAMTPGVRSVRTQMSARRKWEMP